MNLWERVRNWIPVNPLGQSITEVVFAALFTFGPFLLLSVPWVASSGELTGPTVANKFWTFWDNGQIALPILGLCGAIASVAALNGRVIPNWLNVFAWLVAIGVAGAGWFALAETKGFSELLNNEIVSFGFIAYALLAILWIVLNVIANSRSENLSSDERARGLLEEMKRAEKKGGSA